ncbi:MAG: TetR/AcrR family transcriptional regulator [Phaeodactylibacter sp.]|nr:TetR/AcrR family transcriptional regulator [Phaeodactylibacter sp.]MCB9304239.1 TetR/AcrR family transcriptional regulator [Lewinellaceae bacterium]HQU58303.1 TetR/AcrR family transcriptional regulator [Saprospiraceae bacterium]
MSTLPMKKQIVQKAIELFNQRGFFDVRIRDISTALDVSVGSVTYHYKSKEALMESIYRYMLKTLEGLDISGRLFQKKGEELEVAQVYMVYMQQFRFFFQDTLDIIRTYPEIGQRHRQQVLEEINIIKNILYMHVGKGTLVSEPAPGIYDSLADMIWQTLHFWFARQTILGDTTPGWDDAVRRIGHLVYPYLTEERKAENQEIMPGISLVQ